MFFYLWPAIVFHGIRDGVAGKLRKLFMPFFTQWKSSRTKRKRDTTLKGWLDLKNENEPFQKFSKVVNLVFCLNHRFECLMAICYSIQGGLLDFNSRSSYLWYQWWWRFLFKCNWKRHNSSLPYPTRRKSYTWTTFW